MNAKLRGLTIIILLIVPIVLILLALPDSLPLAQAAPAIQNDELQACSGEASIEIADAPCKDIQIVFLIDDSGSMGFPRIGNDLNGQRFKAVNETVDQLAELYLDEKDAQARRLPKINVAAIHFATGIDYNSGWVQIAPPSHDAWGNDAGEPGVYKTETENLLINDKIRNLRYNTNRDRRTDFRNPFREAASLLNNIEKPNPQGCPNRLVFVLTDGAPDEGNGELHRITPLSRMKTALVAHFATVRQYAAQLESPIYVLAFRGSDRTYWNATEAYWKDRIATDALQVYVENRGDTGELPNLLDFVKTKVEQTLVGSAYDVPAYLEALEVTYQAPNARARLDILGPDGNVLVPDGEKVTLTGEGTLEQVWRIQNPLPGGYVFKPLNNAGDPQPGGGINLRFVYPAVEGEMAVDVLPPNLQQYTYGDIHFHLLDAEGHPLQFKENYPPRFLVTFSPPDGETPLPNLTPKAGEFTITNTLPLSTASGTLDVGVVVLDHNKNDCVLYRDSDKYDVDPVGIVAKPVDDLVCTPSGMPIRFPLTLVNVKKNNPTTISLPIEWQIEAVHENGSPVEASVEETSDPSVYELSLSTEDAGRITTSVTASVQHDSQTAVLYEDTFKTTHLMQDRSYAFELTGVETLADNLSIRFNQWFKRISTDPSGTLLIGRIWFDWFGQQEVLVSGRFYDKVSGGSVAGIERYTVALVPADGGEAVASSNNWQDAGNGQYTITFTAPALGAYQVVVTDNGEPAPCVVVDPPGVGLSIILINHYWEYLFCILLILLILILIILLILWLLCLRGKPLVVYLKDYGDLLDSPAQAWAHILAHLDARHALMVIEEATQAIRKIDRQSGWLYVFTQVEGFVAAETVCRDNGQAILRVPSNVEVSVSAEADLNSETLLTLVHVVPVTVLEEYEDWLRIRVIAVGYVDACTLQPPKRRFRMRCWRRLLVITVRANETLRDAPIQTGSFEVASLLRDTQFVVLEDEVQALDKIKRSAEWLLVQTKVTGFVETRSVDRDAGDVLMVQYGGRLEVYEQANTDSSSLLTLVHSAQVKVLEEAGGWLKVAVFAKGYLQAGWVCTTSETFGPTHLGRPLIESGPVMTVECPPGMSGYKGPVKTADDPVPS